MQNATLNGDLYIDLKNQIANKKVVVFVGAGVSVGTTNGNPVASWKGLLLNGLDRCKEVVTGLNQAWVDRWRVIIDQGDTEEWIAVAEEITRRLTTHGGEYSRWLQGCYGTLRVENDDTIKAIKNLDLPIITTNYDSLIEEVTHLRPVTWQNREILEQVIRGDQRRIIHIHGHWEEPNSVVLGMRSYDAILGDNHTQAFLQALRSMTTFLFIGYGAGLQDPNFSKLLKWAKETFSGSQYRHYRLARTSDVNSIQEQHSPESRIYVLSHGDEHNDLAEYLGTLIPNPQ